MVQQPAWQVLIASGKAKERFRKAIYAEARRAPRTIMISRRRANISGLPRTPPRERLPALQHARIPRGDKMATPNRRWRIQFLRRAACGIIHTDEPLGIYADRLRRLCQQFHAAAQALGLGTIPQAALARHSGLIRRHFNLAATAAWSAAFRSALPTTRTRSTAIAPRGRACRHRDFHRRMNHTGKADRQWRSGFRCLNSGKSVGADIDVRRRMREGSDHCCCRQSLKPVLM